MPLVNKSFTGAAYSIVNSISLKNILTTLFVSFRNKNENYKPNST